MNGSGLFAPHRSCEHAEQIRPVDGEIRMSVALDRDLPQVEELPRLAGVPEADFLARSFAGERLQFFADAEGVEDARAVRAELQAGADFFQLVRLLVDIDVAAAPQGGQRSGETADPRACD